jgi:hypothetical protein
VRREKENKSKERKKVKEKKKKIRVRREMREKKICIIYLFINPLRIFKLEILFKSNFILKNIKVDTFLQFKILLLLLFYYKLL